MALKACHSNRYNELSVIFFYVDVNKNLRSYNIDQPIDQPSDHPIAQLMANTPGKQGILEQRGKLTSHSIPETVVMIQANRKAKELATVALVIIK